MQLRPSKLSNLLFAALLVQFSACGVVKPDTQLSQAREPVIIGGGDGQVVILPPDDGGSVIIDPPNPDIYGGEWFAYFYDNMYLSGPVSFSTSYPGKTLNRNYGDKSYAPFHPADYFSARFQKFVNLNSGTYRFNADSDDGIRAYLIPIYYGPYGERNFGIPDLLFEDWTPHGLSSPQKYNAERTIPSGDYLISIEYFEKEGGAAILFDYQDSPTSFCSPSQWQVEFFYAYEFQRGGPSFMKDCSDFSSEYINQAWSDNVLGDNWYSVWTKTFVPKDSSKYKITVSADDGIEAFVNGNLVTWNDLKAVSPAKPANIKGSGLIDLRASQPYTLRIVHREDTGNASLHYQMEKYSCPTEVGTINVCVKPWDEKTPNRHTFICKTFDGQTCAESARHFENYDLHNPVVKPMKMGGLNWNTCEAKPNFLVWVEQDSYKSPKRVVGWTGDVSINFDNGYVTKDPNNGDLICKFNF